jgi:hypothetical protein
MWWSDFECFAHDWLFVAKRQSDGETIAVWNDPDTVQDFVSLMSPVLCGFNYRDYDSWLLKGVLLGWSPEDIHNISTTIIDSDDRSLVWGLFSGSPWVKLPPVIDLFHDVVPRKGLKEIEGNIGMSIVESSVPFDISRPLTPEEREEVQMYCLHDIEATAALYDLRYDYIKAKSDLCELRGIDPLTMLQHTNARIVSEVLEAQRMADHPFETYEIPNNVDLTAIPQSVIEYVGKVNTDNCMDNDAPKVEFLFHDCPTTFALGGIHAAVPSYAETSTEDRVILHQDVGSFYPSLILNNGYMSRAVPDPSIYREFYDLRMKAKADGDKATAEAAKLVLNTTYGTFKDTYNKLFDPMQGTNVCLSGQLYILDLIEQMYRNVSNLQLIQLNTDGWVISCNRSDEAAIHAVVLAWQERTHFTVDTVEVQRIVQANVNNYVMRTVDGKVKAKGGVVAKFAGGDFRSNSATIIDKAVVDYLLDGTPIENTITECDDLERFQIIAKAGRTFQKVVVQTIEGEPEEWADYETQRVNRIYASRDDTRGGIFKVKMENGVETGRSRIPLSPEHVLVDNENLWQHDENGLTFIDKTWYITLAKKKAHEFITRDKKEKEQMAETQEPHNEVDATPKPTRKAAKKDEAVTVAAIPTFPQKLLQLQKSMAEVAKTVVFDKVVDKINHEYADTQQYKVWLSANCSALGLLFEFNINHTEWLGAVSTDGKLYGVLVDGEVVIRDADSDGYAAYGVSGTGMNFTPGYCNGGAQTNALRNFILNNYLLDNMGRDGDDVGLNAAEAKVNGYVNPAEKAALKQGIAADKADDAQYATDLFANALHDKIMEARAIEGHEKFKGKVLKTFYNEDGTPILGANGKSTMLKKDAVQRMTEAEEIIAGAAE